MKHVKTLQMLTFNVFTHFVKSLITVLTLDLLIFDLFDYGGSFLKIFLHVFLLSLSLWSTASSSVSSDDSFSEYFEDESEE